MKKNEKIETLKDEKIRTENKVGNTNIKEWRH